MVPWHSACGLTDMPQPTKQILNTGNIVLAHIPSYSDIKKRLEESPLHLLRKQDADTKARNSECAQGSGAGS